MPKSIIIWGKGGHSKVVSGILYKQNIHYTLIDDHDKHSDIESVTKAFPPKDYNMHIAIGDNKQRKTIYNRWSPYYNMATIIGTDNIFDSVKIGKGSLISTGAIIHPDAIIGNNTIINTGVIIEHDTIIGDHVHIAPGVIICGNVEIQKEVSVFSGSVISPKAIIEECSIVGANSFVMNHIKSHSLYAGSPAKKKRNL